MYAKVAVALALLVASTTALNANLWRPAGSSGGYDYVLPEAGATTGTGIGVTFRLVGWHIDV